MKYDSALARYIRVRAKRNITVTSDELVYYIYTECDGNLDEAVAIVSDFLARREQVRGIIHVLEQQREKLLDAERKALMASLRHFARRQKLRDWLSLLRPLLFLAPIFFPLRSYIWWFCIYFVLLGDGIINIATGKRRDVAAMKTLIQKGGTQTVGLLAEALILSDVKALAKEALIHELPRLKATDADLLNDEQRGYLYSALNDNNLALVRAILKTLEQIGDEKAIPHVEKLVRGEGKGKIREVREAAVACLPYLRERAHAVRESQTLLRASAQSATANNAPDTLLRPAQYSSATDPEQLLRASGET